MIHGKYIITPNTNIDTYKQLIFIQTYANFDSIVIDNRKSDNYFQFHISDIINHLKKNNSNMFFCNLQPNKKPNIVNINKLKNSYNILVDFIIITHKYNHKYISKNIHKFISIF